MIEISFERTMDKTFMILKEAIENKKIYKKFCLSSNFA